MTEISTEIPEIQMGASSESTLEKTGESESTLEKTGESESSLERSEKF